VRGECPPLYLVHAGRCVQVFLRLSLEDQQILLRRDLELADESLFSLWHVMFASSCISETEDFDTRTNKFLMVIRQHSSITLACVKNYHWSDEQQVNVLILNWYCNIFCHVKRQLCIRYLKVVYILEAEYVCLFCFVWAYVLEPYITELEKQIVRKVNWIELARSG
jgi:hypothetical protein